MPSAPLTLFVLAVCGGGSGPTRDLGGLPQRAHGAVPQAGAGPPGLAGACPAEAGGEALSIREQWLQFRADSWHQSLPPGGPDMAALVIMSQGPGLRSGQLPRWS